MLAEHMVRPASHVFGNPNAKLQVVEFSDLQCPFCGMAEKPAEELRARYGSQIQFIFRQFPLTMIHPYAEKAAEASECAADQGKFWEAVQKFYSSQGNLSVASLQRQAAELGLDMPKFNQCLQSGEMAGRVRRDMEDGVALGIRATPTFFIGQYRIQTALSFPQLAQVVNAELARLSFMPVGPGGLPGPARTSETPAPSGAERPGMPEKRTPAKQSSSNPTVAPPAASAPGPAKTKTAPTPATGFGAGSAASSLLGSSGGDTGCGENGAAGTEPPMIRTGEALQLFRAQSLFVDVRPAADFKEGRIARAVNVPLGEIVGRADDLPKNKTIVVYESGRAPGEVCAASKAAARILLARGFPKVMVYQDGFAGWEKDGLPREP
jgi:predicted DsbA family dithiol-disulfide isomerase/rhodanese-related sulfurtransferase